MNYICGDDREQIRIELMEDYVEKDSEVRVIDKIVDAIASGVFHTPLCNLLSGGLCHKIAKQINPNVISNT